MRARRLRRGRQFALGGLLVLLIPVGVAHLAQNTVPVTYAGQTEVSIPSSVSTEIAAASNAKVNVAQDQDYYQFTNLSATLSFDGGPIEGATMLFTVPGTGSTAVPVCSDVTDKHGDATCSSDVRALVAKIGSTPPTQFTVSFAGLGVYGPVQVDQDFQKDTGNGGQVNNT
jgi:hypothetical protein